MADYEYDVFFSYKRDELTREWHEKVKVLLEYWIRQELNVTKIRIFMDTEDIKTGDKWKQIIEKSLRNSKCLVGIWSPDYFHSRWCLSEWASFRERDKIIKQDSPIILPARYHDGDSFPEEARNLQSRDFTEFNSTMAYFWKSEDGFEFEKKLKEFAKEIAEAIKNAPEYRDDFPIIIIEEQDVQEPKKIERITV
ncbi:MAG: toll/interleukin-1 receptor domain-containing protein [Bacteroidales bacterium]|nr:toll/interleukin-1 receptor domain-containing protein [Candidatus Latescibacterota bacterium]